jgi:hypothetical protein
MQRHGWNKVIAHICEIHAAFPFLCVAQKETLPSYSHAEGVTISNRYPLARS